MCRVQADRINISARSRYEKSNAFSIQGMKHFFRGCFRCDSVLPLALGLRPPRSGWTEHKACDSSLERVRW